MFIKQITIQGFKSYKDQTFVEPFSPHHNVIVGRNGSGKSNFFNAILFVLSEKFSKLKSEERQALLHEGTGRGVMVAFVEIKFDNSGNRLPIDKREVTIRRTIGLKKDEYRVNNKSVTQREVLNLLESAGFSSSNPYYIVEQGKVSHLTVMKDSERLELLKEVAGTNVYDEKRKDSLKIMRTMNAKKKKIDSIIEYIEGRIEELEMEVKKLKKFQKLDKKRRCVEYNIYDKERSEAHDSIEDLEEKRSEFNENRDLLYQQQLVFQERVKRLERELAAAKMELSDRKKEDDLLQEEKKSLVKKATRLNLELEDKKEENKSQEDTLKKNQKNLKKLEKQIEKVQKNVSSLVPKFEKIEGEEMSLRKELENNELRKGELLVKQGGRNNQFNTKKERDLWIKEQIRSSALSMNEDNERVTELKDRIITSLKEEIKNTKNVVKKKERELLKNIEDSENLDEKLEELKTERNRLTTFRKEKWRDQNELQKKVEKIENDLKSCQKELESTRSKECNLGIKSVNQICKERNISGVHGTVIHNFKTKPKFRKSIEAVAGNRLFHMVVDNDKISSDIIKIMIEGNYPGRVTFMPLNQLNYVKAPRDISDSSNSPALIKVISYKKELEKAFWQIFGKTYLCKDLSIATKFSKEYNVDCVTLDGDKASKRGALTGGWMDPSKSRLEVMDNIRSLRKKRDDETDNLDKLKDIIENEIGVSITKITAEINDVSPRLRNLQNLINTEQSNIRALKNSILTLQEQVKENEREISLLKNKIEKNLKQQNSFQSELKTDFTETNLSSSEQEEFTSLTEMIETQKKKVTILEKEKVKVESKLGGLRTKLNSNLLIRQEQLKVEIEMIEMNNKTSRFEDEDALKQKEELQKELNYIDKKTSSMLDVISNSNKLIKKLSDQYEKLKMQEGSKSRQVESDSNKLLKLLSKKKIYQRKERDAIAKIRDLGTIPENQIEYSEYTMKQLMDDLRKIKEKLKKYAHVNKKAVDQYEQFTRQKEEFVEKKKDLDLSAEAITKLIRTLDRKKNEAIERTFKQVSTNFSEIFEELVPGGKATLIMKESKEEDNEEEGESSDDDEDEEEGEDGDVKMSNEDDELDKLEKQAKKVEKFKRIPIRVQFGNQLESQFMHHLSGGQKTLVALTLIFAIQKCDPAPFYLFDEIDSALDSAYRTAIAKMINKQATEENIQFITTTFKNELIDVADNWYRIQYANKVSRIKPVSKDEAKRVLQEQEQIRRKKKKKKRVDDDFDD